MIPWRWVGGALVVGLAAGFIAHEYVEPRIIMIDCVRCEDGCDWAALREFSMGGFDIGASSVRMNCEYEMRKKWKARLDQVGMP